MIKNIVIFGASGHGSVVLDCIEKEDKFGVVGFMDSFKQKGAKFNGYQILGSEYDLPYLIEKYNIVGGIVAIGDNWIRKMVVERICKIIPDFNFISTVHPKASIGKNVAIGRGSVVMPGVVVNTNSRVGNFCILNTNSSLDHDGIINDYASMAPGVCTGGNFVLGRYSAVCLGTNIIENITIGEHSVIGAGSLVVNDCASKLIVYGSPAKVIRKRIIGEQYLTGNKDNDATVIPFFANDF